MTPSPAPEGPFRRWNGWRRLAARVVHRAGLALAIGLAGTGAAQAVEDPATPVRLVDNADGVSLVGRVAFLEDTDADLDIATLRSKEGDARFHYPADPLQGKESRRVLWFKLQLQLGQTEDASRDWLLVVPTVSTHDLRFYGPYAADAPVRAEPPAHVTGMRHPWATRDASSEKMAYRFRLPDTRPHTVYMRVESEFARIYAMSVWQPATYLESTQDKRIFDGLCYGVLLAMLVLAPPLLLVFRERIYVYYLLSCAFALLSIANFNGHVLRYLFPDSPALAGLCYQLTPALWAICKLMFARQLLDLRTYAPRLDKVVHALVLLIAGAMVASILGLHPYLLPIVQVTVVAATAVMAASAVAAARQRHWPSLFFIASVAALLAGISLMIVESWGWLSWKPAHMEVTQVALAAELLIFGIALAARIRMLSRATRTLEQRTRTLLHELSIDPLTGVASRKRFEEAARAVIDAGLPAAVVLADLNGFKAVNDTHGHAAGDVLLAAIGARLGQQLRGTDVVARLGGDEFALLVTRPGEREQLRTLAHRLLDAAARPVRHEGHELRVTASLGIACFPSDGDSLEALLRGADLAMYAGKQHRSGCVTFADEAKARADRPRPAGSSPETAPA